MRAGLGFGSAPLSFSLREQILSAMRSLEDAEGVEDTRRCVDCVEVVDEGGVKGSGELVWCGGRGGIASTGESTITAKEASWWDDRDNGGGLLLLLGRCSAWIVLDFFRNPNLPLSVTLACLASNPDRISTFPAIAPRSPNSDISAIDEDDAVLFDPTVDIRDICRPRERRSARVRREDRARFTSWGSSASVSADDSGELPATTGAEAGGRGTAPVWGEGVLQRGRRVRRPRGYDEVVTGAEDGPFGTGSSNEMCRIGSGLGMGSISFGAWGVR